MFLLAKEATHYEPGTMRVNCGPPDEHEPSPSCCIAVGFASVHGPQETVHGTIADLAAMFEAFFHLMSLRQRLALVVLNAAHSLKEKINTPGHARLVP
jgi:hypothetical protein